MSFLRSARQLWANSVLKRSVVIGILLLTTLAVIHFFQQHPKYLTQLGTISPWTVVWVLLLNSFMLAVLIAATEVTLRLCGKSLAIRENFQLTSYSSVANFFGPLQSGPGVRAAYLKLRHGVRLRDYTLASLILLGFFALFSALFLCIGTRPWWQTTGSLLLVAAVSYKTVSYFKQRDNSPASSQFKLRPGLVGSLAVLAFLQVLITCGWYFVELKAVDSGIHFSQAMSYAGAANFSLFVSVTPDGVGVREAFLLFSQHIHHVPTGDIVSANIIDRAVYVLFLLLLLGILTLTHASSKLRLKELSRDSAKS